MQDYYIFNIGFNRCGTTSLTEALKILGYNTLHFSIDGSIWNEDDSNQIESVIRTNQNNDKKLFKGLHDDYQAFTDFFGEYYYQVLYRQYPNSKFILTTRPVEDWIVSVIKMEKKQRRSSYTTEENTKKRIIELVNHYFNYKKEIKDFFKDKPNTLLQMDIPSGDGWEVLCTFLSKPIPKNIPFPNLNQSEF